MKKLSFLLTFFLLIHSPLLAGSGMAFLNMPSSARSAGAMNVFASEFSGASVLFENPVGIMQDKTNINFTNNFWFADINQSVLTLGKQTGFATFGAGINFVNSPGIEVRSKPTDEPEGEINAQYLSVALGMSKKILPRVYLGVNTKYLYQSLYTEKASGMALDMSALWRMPSNMNLTVALQNLGKMAELKESATPLPTVAKFGLVRPDILDKKSPVNASIGIYFDQYLEEEITEINVGGEVDIYDKFFLRGGYSIQQEYNNASFGLGMTMKSFTMDFALLMLPEIPDTPYLFSLSYNL